MNITYVIIGMIFGILLLRFLRFVDNELISKCVAISCFIIPLFAMLISIFFGIDNSNSHLYKFSSNFYFGYVSVLTILWI